MLQVNYIQYVFLHYAQILRVLYHIFTDIYLSVFLFYLYWISVLPIEMEIPYDHLKESGEEANVDIHC